MSDYVARRDYANDGVEKFMYQDISLNKIQIPFRFGGLLRSTVSEIQEPSANLMFGFFVKYLNRWHFIGMQALRNPGDTATDQNLGISHGLTTRNIGSGIDLVFDSEVNFTWSADTWYWVSGYIFLESDEIKLQLDADADLGSKARPGTWTNRITKEVIAYDTGDPRVIEIGVWQFSRDLGTPGSIKGFWDNLFVDQIEL